MLPAFGKGSALVRKQPLPWLLWQATNPSGKSKASLTTLCGVSRLQACSGKTVRHRLNRDGQIGEQRTMDHCDGAHAK